MIRVAIDAQSTVGTATGIGEYVRGLVPALVAEHIETRSLRAPWLDPWRFDRRVLWDQVLLPIAAARSGCAVLHCTSGTMPAAASLPIVTTVHDVAWLRTQRHTRAYARYYFGTLTAQRYRAAAAIIVDSLFSRDELLACVTLDEHRIRVVYPGVDVAFAQLQRAVDTEPTILAVGTVEPRKNLATAIAALPRCPQARLIAVGPGTPYVQECAELARHLGVADRVEFRGYVARAELLALYARSRIAIVPSRYEGFGYAAAQAMCAGVPLLAARSSSLVEVVDDSSRLVDPDDPSAWADAIEALLSDSQAQARAQAGRAIAAARFGWSAAARDHAEVYRSVASVNG